MTKFLGSLSRLFWVALVCCLIILASLTLPSPGQIRWNGDEARADDFVFETTLGQISFVVTVPEGYTKSIDEFKNDLRIYPAANVTVVELSSGRFEVTLVDEPEEETAYRVELEEESFSWNVRTQEITRVTDAETPSENRVVFPETPPPSTTAAEPAPEENTSQTREEPSFEFSKLEESSEMVTPIVENSPVEPVFLTESPVEETPPTESSTLGPRSTRSTVYVSSSSGSGSSVVASSSPLLSCSAPVDLDRAALWRISESTSELRYFCNYEDSRPHSYLISAQSNQHFSLDFSNLGSEPLEIFLFTEQESLGSRVLLDGDDWSWDLNPLRDQDYSFQIRAAQSGALVDVPYELNVSLEYSEGLDLAISNPKINGNTLSYELINSGTAELVLSGGSDLIQLGQQSISLAWPNADTRLSPGDSLLRSSSILDVFGTLEYDDYALSIQADGTQVLAESNESNNLVQLSYQAPCPTSNNAPRTEGSPELLQSGLRLQGQLCTSAPYEYFSYPVAAGERFELQVQNQGSSEMEIFVDAGHLDNLNRHAGRYDIAPGETLNLALDSNVVDQFKFKAQQFYTEAVLTPYQIMLESETVSGIDLMSRRLSYDPETETLLYTWVNTGDAPLNLLENLGTDQIWLNHELLFEGVWKDIGRQRVDPGEAYSRSLDLRDFTAYQELGYEEMVFQLYVDANQILTETDEDNNYEHRRFMRSCLPLASSYGTQTITSSTTYETTLCAEDSSSQHRYETSLNLGQTLILQIQNLGEDTLVFVEDGSNHFIEAGETQSLNFSPLALQNYVFRLRAQQGPSIIPYRMTATLSENTAQDLQAKRLVVDQTNEILSYDFSYTGDSPLDLTTGGYNNLYLNGEVFYRFDWSDLGVTELAPNSSIRQELLLTDFAAYNELAFAEHEFRIHVDLGNRFIESDESNNTMRRLFVPACSYDPYGEPYFYPLSLGEEVETILCISQNSTRDTYRLELEEGPTLNGVSLQNTGSLRLRFVAVADSTSQEMIYREGFSISPGESLDLPLQHEAGYAWTFYVSGTSSEPVESPYIFATY